MRTLLRRMTDNDPDSGSRRWHWPDPAQRLVPQSVEDARWFRVVSNTLYLFAAVFLIRAVFQMPTINDGSDFIPIWDAVQRYTSGEAVYNEDYSTEAPHYLWSPGATALLSPIALLGDFDLARRVLLLLGAACILASLYLCIRMITAHLTSQLMAVAVIATFAPAEPVVSTLVLTNINGFLLLLMVLLVLMSLSDVSDRHAWSQGGERSGESSGEHSGGHRLRHLLLRRRTLIGGLVLGLAVTIKPQFGVLAFIPLVSGQLVLLVIAGLVVIGLFAIGWLTMNTPMDYVDNLLPYLGEPRSYNNGSISGIALNLGWNSTAEYLCLAALLAVTVAAVVLLWRWRFSDPVMWAFSTLGVLFVAIIMSSGLHQAYYCMWLLPMAVTVLCRRSPMHNPVMWLAFFIFMTSTHWPVGEIPVLPEVFGNLQTVAWLAVPFATVWWAVAERRRDTADC